MCSKLKNHKPSLKTIGLEVLKGTIIDLHFFECHSSNKFWRLPEKKLIFYETLISIIPWDLDFPREINNQKSREEIKFYEYIGNDGNILIICELFVVAIWVIPSALMFFWSYLIWEVIVQLARKFRYFVDG